MKARILIVDDEDDIVELLSYNLQKEGYILEKAYDGKQGLEKAQLFNPHLIVLDIMMPEMDGIELCTLLRQDSSFDKAIIAFLTARNESFTQVHALDIGGDDFITKPIKIDVFVSRIRALLRRHPELKLSTDTNIITLGDLIINPEAYSIEIKGETIYLAKKEFELLLFLTTKPGKVYKRKDILNNVWGTDVVVGDRTIDVHIRKLREKIGSDFISTIKGVGYKFSL